MTKLTWDKIGERLYETGVDHGALYTMDSTGKYNEGVAWNGLTSVTEKPDGAEETSLYADNIKYLSLYSEEVMKGTIEAYTYPDEFAACDGSASLAEGVVVGQQTRKGFGLAYRSKIGNDTEQQDHGYKLHILYNAKVSPSERSYETVNDKPDAISLSWDFTTTPVEVTPDLKPSSLITIDSTKVDAAKLKTLEEKLFGDSDDGAATLPTPAEVIAMFQQAASEKA